tara:strand:+ start:593 stop:1828 length:1236 start_codon:yes stop_codon:yes gene_type:complete
MRRPLSFFVGLRFSLAKKHNLLLSFVSLASMLGISFGVLVLIVATSVINGSINVMRLEALKSVPHAVIQGIFPLENWNQNINQLLGLEGVYAVAPFLEGEAVVRNQGNFEFIKIRGVLPEKEQTVISNPSQKYLEVLRDLKNTEQGIILGTQLAASLDIFNARSINAVSLEDLLQRSSMDIQGFKVVGFADFGLYGNSNLALINMKDAQSFFGGERGGNVNLRLSVDDINNAKLIGEQIENIYPMVDVISWDEAQSSLFTALNLEKILTSIMLVMIIVIGAVNIISTLVMVVSNKSSDIAILRTLGATKSMIMKIFVVQGMISGILGTLLGVSLGTIFALYAPKISQIGENIVNQFVVGGDLYFISHLRTQVNPHEVIAIGAVAMLISFFATLYPAYRASKIHPAEVLRYE